MSESPKPGSGNVEITLVGTKHVMKPCYEAFSAINNEIPGGIVAAITRVSSYDINAIESVIANGIGFFPHARIGLGQKIFDTGTKNLASKCLEFLVNLNNGGEKPNPAEETTPNPTTQETT